MEPKTLLHHSLCQYLQNNGFSKTLHKFLSEAKINQDDGWKDGSLDLEEVYYKCLLTRDCIASVETASKTKKKKSDKSDRNAVDNQCQEKDKISNGKKSEEIVTSDLVPESAVISKKEKKIKTTYGSIKEVAEQVRSDVLTESANDIVNEPLVEKKCKDKKKKKVKSGSEFLVDTLDDHQNEAQPKTTEEKCATDSEISMKPKDKKKKKEKLVSDHTDNNEQCGMGDKQWVTKCMDEEADSVKSKGKKKRKVDLVLESLPDKSMDELDKSKSRNNSQKDDFQTSEDAAINKESKESKKRKRLASEDNNSQPIDKVAVEKSKRRKTEGMEESQPNMQLKELDASLESDGHAGKGSKEQNGKVCFNDSQERAINHLDTHSNGNLERHEENLSVQKSSKKQHNGSVEPKTVNAFQRVKIDKVVFTDEKLQDNSYWAKDGAEIGYGAKAQEVLGQVRGRDFRHEKTKKKRGSYRGGQIDLHSHSVKFNYSDED